MRKIAGPVSSALLTETQLDLDLEVLVLENHTGASLVDLLRLSVDEELKLSRAVGGNERDRDLGRVNLKVGL